MINGTTGNGFQPNNATDVFKVLNKTSTGTITRTAHCAGLSR